LLDVLLEALVLPDVLVLPLEELAVPPVPLPPVEVPLLDEPEAPLPPVPVLTVPDPPHADAITTGQMTTRAMWVVRKETSRMRCR
jgi:hypothetical protein